MQALSEKALSRLGDPVLGYLVNKWGLVFHSTLELLLVLVTLFLSLSWVIYSFFLKSRIEDMSVHPDGLFVRYVRFTTSLFYFSFFIAIIKLYVVDLTHLENNELEPDINKNEHILVLRSFYSLRFPGYSDNVINWKTPQLGDYVLYVSPLVRGKRHLGRIAGLPGNQVNLDLASATYKINNKPKKFNFKIGNLSNKYRKAYQWKVPKHSYLLLPNRISDQVFSEIIKINGKTFRIENKLKKRSLIIKNKNIIGKAFYSF